MTDHSAASVGDAEGSEQPLPEPFSWTLEVALSGGGLRASAYALGALLYLVHSGLNAKVRNISSVSGGSITNAFVACGCDFHSVEFPEFLKVAGFLAEKIAYRGLLQRWESWAWAAAVAIIAAASALDLIFEPSQFALAGIAPTLALLVLLYWRSWPIYRWMRSLLRQDATLGSVQSRDVDHVFCATDLKFGQPFFFSTADSGRLFSTVYGLARTPGVPVVKAVRASAAFPPFIPPLALKVEAEWAYEQGMMPLTSVTPVRLWLTDGGAFNNFGTEWHRMRRELRTAEFINRAFERTNGNGSVKDDFTLEAWYGSRYGQVQLIVDASRLGAASHMRSLGIPIVGFFTYVRRTMDVMYASTLAGRSDWPELTASFRMKSYPWKWLASLKNSELVERIFENHPQPYDENADSDSIDRGALSLYVLHSRPFNDIAKFWSVADFYHGKAQYERMFRWPDTNKAAAKAMGSHWPWTGETEFVRPKNEEVPTTFRKLGKDRTLKLIIEGYLKTREVLFWSFRYAGPPIPELKVFESLLLRET